MLPVLLQGLGSLCGLVGLVCFVLVIVQMFKRDESKMGIICLVTLLCCGIGYFIALVYGWIKVKEWDIKNIMVAWTIAFALGSVLNGIAFVLSAGEAAKAINEGQFNVQPGDMNFEMPEGFPQPGEE